MSEGYLHVDYVLMTLIGSDDGPAESLVAAAERGQEQFLILDSVLYWALCCVQSHDRLNLGRFCRLLRCAKIVPSLSPRPLEYPGVQEIARWREAALAR